LKKLLVFLLVFLFPLSVWAETVRDDCDQIPAIQRVTNGTLCLQRTTVSGRQAGSLYVWDGNVWVVQASTGDITEVQGTAGELQTSSGTGPIPVLSFPSTVVLSTKTLQLGRLELATDQSPAQLVANTNDFALTSTTVNLRLSTDQSRNLTGLAGGSAGRIVTIHNVGANALVLTDEDGASLIGNRFALSGALTLNADTSVILEYDGTSQRWRALSTSAGGVVDQTAAYSWSGAHTFQRNKFSILDTADATKMMQFDNSGNATKTTRTYTVPDASTRLLGDSDISTTGVVARTAANTYAGRTLASGNTNYLAWTNGNGVAGAPSINIGPNVLATDRSNTVTAGDQDLGSATSFKVPVGAGATPTVSGRLAYDSTTNRYKFGANGSTLLIPSLAEVQTLNSNLTALGGLTGAAATIPYFTGVGAMSLSTFGLCIDSAGQHLNITSTAPLTFSCGTSSTGGLSGLTTNKYLLATGATSAGTAGALSEAGGVVSTSGGAVIGASPYLVFDTSAIAASDKTWTVLNFSGTIRPSTGAITAGHVVTVDANGLLVDGGAAGAGTWTDSSTSTGTNKTLVATDAGGTNTITTGVKAFWDAAALTPDGTNCTDATKTTINSGPVVYIMNCTDNAGSTFDGHITLPTAVATVTFTITVDDVDSSSQHFAGTFKAQCRASGATVNNTYGTGQTVDITMVSANVDYKQTTAAVTPNATCSAGAELYWKFTVDTTPHTDTGNARILGVLMKQAS
jgi:hypothetical protein